MVEGEATLSIGDVARATGLRPSALRYYEEAGLIRPARRVGGRRHYRPDVVSRLAVVALAQDAGFTVAEVKELLRGHGKHQERWREMAERKLVEVDAKLASLQAMRRLLEAAAACECNSFDACEFVVAAGERRVRRATGPG